MWRASAGSRQRQARDARGTRSTFLSWEVSSNSLASLVAELPEDKRSDYKADRGQTAEMPGERRNQALRGRSQAEGRPLAAVSDPALKGLRAPDTRDRRAPHPLRATPPTAAPARALPDSPCPASAHWQHRATPFPPEGQGGWLAGSGDDAPNSATPPGGSLSPAGSRGRRTGSGAPRLKSLLNKNGIFLGLRRTILLSF